MEMRVLGCHGGELPQHRTTCFLIDGTLAIDAGALTSSLSLDSLLLVDDLILSHSHLDHIKDLPFLADLLVGRRNKPVVIHASAACAHTLRSSVFNNELWPDFTSIPSKANPVLEIRLFQPHQEITVGGYRVTPIPVAHSVETFGFVISDGRAALGISGDTGPTDAFWQSLNSTDGLQVVLLETSFPNQLQKLADASGHLTPNTARDELKKFHPKNPCRLFFYHLKPAYVSQIKNDLQEMEIDGRVLELGEMISLE